MLRSVSDHGERTEIFLSKYLGHSPGGDTAERRSKGCVAGPSAGRPRLSTHTYLCGRSAHLHNPLSHDRIDIRESQTEFLGTNPAHCGPFNHERIA